MGVKLQDLELNSKRGWFVKVGNTSVVADKDRFLCSLKAAHLTYNENKNMYGEDSKATLRARRTMNYYYGQIDENTSDVMTLLMFDPNEWDV